MRINAEAERERIMEAIRTPRKRNRAALSQIVRSLDAELREAQARSARRLHITGTAVTYRCSRPAARYDIALEQPVRLTRIN